MNEHLQQENAMLLKQIESKNQTIKQLQDQLIYLTKLNHPDSDKMSSNQLFNKFVAEQIQLQQSQFKQNDKDTIIKQISNLTELQRIKQYQLLIGEYSSNKKQEDYPKINSPYELTNQQDNTIEYSNQQYYLLQQLSLEKIANKVLKQQNKALKAQLNNFKSIKLTQSIQCQTEIFEKSNDIEDLLSKLKRMQDDQTVKLTTIGDRQQSQNNQSKEKHTQTSQLKIKDIFQIYSIDQQELFQEYKAKIDYQDKQIQTQLYHNQNIEIQTDKQSNLNYQNSQKYIQFYEIPNIKFQFKKFNRNDQYTETQIENTKQDQQTQTITELSNQQTQIEIKYSDSSYQTEQLPPQTYSNHTQTLTHKELVSLQQDKLQLQMSQIIYSNKFN